jgi:hypothetical protein
MAAPVTLTHHLSPLMDTKNPQICLQFVSGFVLASILAAVAAFVWWPRALATGRFSVEKYGEASFIRTDSTTGEIVFYMIADGKLAAYELTAVPVQRGGKLP